MPYLSWLVLLLGLVAVGASIVLPREIGKEEEPIVDLHRDLPRVEDAMLRMRARLRPPHGPSAAALQPDPPPPDQREVEAPAMGATQPVLAQDPLLPFAMELHGRDDPGGGR